MSDFKAKMHQIRFRLALHPRPRWGSLQRSPYPLAGFKGPTSKGRWGKERGDRGRERGSIMWGPPAGRCRGPALAKDGPGNKKFNLKCMNTIFTFVAWRLANILWLFMDNNISKQESLQCEAQHAYPPPEFSHFDLYWKLNRTILQTDPQTDRTTCRVQKQYRLAPQYNNRKRVFFDLFITSVRRAALQWQVCFYPSSVWNRLPIVICGYIALSRVSYI